MMFKWKFKNFTSVNLSNKYENLINIAEKYIGYKDQTVKCEDSIAVKIQRNRVIIIDD